MYTSNMKSYAQLNQDIWVLELLRKQNGWFVEFGAYHPEKLSNTKLLEQHGWCGVSVDPFPHGDWTTRPNTMFIESAVTCDGRQIEFVKADELGGIAEHISAHAAAVEDADRVTISSITPSDVLTAANAPREIDYVSLDVEGAELEILRAFPFDEYDVTLLTVEHNYEEPKRRNIRNLLRTKGFRLIANNLWDDCYVNERAIHNLEEVQ